MLACNANVWNVPTAETTDAAGYAVCDTWPCAVLASESHQISKLPPTLKTVAFSMFRVCGLFADRLTPETPKALIAAREGIRRSGPDKVGIPIHQMEAGTLVCTVAVSMISELLLEDT